MTLEQVKQQQHLTRVAVLHVSPQFGPGSEIGMGFPLTPLFHVQIFGCEGVKVSLGLQNLCAIASDCFQAMGMW